ncbi:MAG: hypothetical protein M3Y66_04365 [Actinomycetota bacterium]|nr:hypothetical protein [Actinomycetota bacterium]
MRLTSELVRYLSRFDSRIVTLASALVLLIFCLVLSFVSVSLAGSVGG